MEVDGNSAIFIPNNDDNDGDGVIDDKDRQIIEELQNSIRK